MWLMRFAIDAVFVDRAGRVVRVAERLPPWRTAIVARGAAEVIELPPAPRPRRARKPETNSSSSPRDLQGGRGRRARPPARAAVRRVRRSGELAVPGVPRALRARSVTGASPPPARTAARSARRSTTSSTRASARSRTSSAPWSPRASRAISRPASRSTSSCPRSSTRARAVARLRPGRAARGRRRRCAPRLPLRVPLRRIRSASPQVALDRAARAENLRGAYVAEAGSLRGARVALVDDVATTGATLAAASGALRGGRCPRRALVRHSVGRVNERVGFARWQMRGLLLFVLAFANLNDIWSPDVLPNALFAWTVVNERDLDYDEFVFRPSGARPLATRGAALTNKLDSEAYFFRACGESTATEPPGTTRSPGGPPAPGPNDHVCSIFPPGTAFLAFPFFAPFVFAGADPAQPRPARARRPRRRRDDRGDRGAASLVADAALRERALGARARPAVLLRDERAHRSRRRRSGSTPACTSRSRSRSGW